MEHCILVYKEGRTKVELMAGLDKLKLEFAEEILNNKVQIGKLPDGFSINAEKKILFLTFWVKAKILIREHEYALIWETNAPEKKVDEGIAKVKEILEKL